MEPALGYDFRRDGADLHRLTAGANVYLLDSHLIATANYRLSVSGDAGHAVFLQLQGGI